MVVVALVVLQFPPVDTDAAVGTLLTRPWLLELSFWGGADGLTGGAVAAGVATTGVITDCETTEAMVCEGVMFWGGALEGGGGAGGGTPADLVSLTGGGAFTVPLTTSDNLLLSKISFAVEL